MAATDSEVQEPPVYHPKDAIQDALKQILIVGGAGLTLSAIQNTLVRQNIGAWGIISRTGGTFALFASVGATFGFAKTACANLREKEDSWNPAIAGFLAGAVGGLRLRTFPAVIGYGAGLSILQGAFDYTGGKFSGYDKDPMADHHARRQALRADKRRPVQEILEEVGEGRGIYGPGYRERRADRIKDTYGIDVPRV